MALIWKTDWQPGDNYAAQGDTHVTRLFFNYEYLRELLNHDFGFAISFTLPTLSGYATYPFDGFLNNIEDALKQLHVWGVPWLEGNKTWQPAEPAPTYMDINRWEQNAASIEQAATNAGKVRFYCNDLYTGEA